jgi:hypothetical protein
VVVTKLGVFVVVGFAVVGPERADVALLVVDDVVGVPVSDGLESAPVVLKVEVVAVSDVIGWSDVNLIVGTGGSENGEMEMEMEGNSGPVMIEVLTPPLPIQLSRRGQHSYAPFAPIWQVVEAGQPPDPSGQQILSGSMQPDPQG